MKHAFLTARIVVVDDQAANVALLRKLLRRWGYENVSSTTDSAAALGLIDAESADLLLLDLQMPDPDGYQILADISGLRAGSTPLPVLVLTADAQPQTKLKALGAGADDFLAKPFDAEEVRLRVSNLLNTRWLQLEVAGHTDALEQRVRDRTRDLETSRLEVLERLARAAEYRDDDTYQHARRVGRTAGLLAEGLGLPRSSADVIRRAAPLHDIGKIGITDAILLKPGRLTADEFEAMKAHAQIGADILAGSSDIVLQTAAEIALTHHERWDGSGYPRGLAGPAIALSGQLTAIADVFDALTHARPYKKAWPLEQAVAEIVGLGGRHFAADAVEIFASLDHRTLLGAVPRDDGSQHRARQRTDVPSADPSLVQAIFSHAPDAMLVADHERRYVAANRAACALLGLDQRELLARRIDDFIAPDGVAQMAQLWDAFIEARTAAGEMRLQLLDGSVVDVNFHALANVLPGRHLSILRRVPAPGGES